MPQLVWFDRDAAPRTREILEDRISIGKAKENHVVMDQRGVSRQHAEIVSEGGQWILLDAGSSNFLYVAGKQVTRHVLEHGTLFSLGNSVTLLYLERPDDELTTRFRKTHAPRPPEDLLKTAIINPGVHHKAVEELEGLFEVGAAINSSLQLDVVLQNIVEKAVSLTRADIGHIMLVENGKLRIEATRNVSPLTVLADDVSFSRTFAEKVIDRNETLVFQRMQEVPISMSVMVQNIGSIMGAPLKVRDTTIGCLYVDSRQATVSFGEQDRPFFTALANQAALAIQNARMADTLRNRVSELETLYEVSRLLNVEHDADAVLNRLLQKARELLGAEGACLLLVGGEHRVLSPAICDGSERAWSPIVAAMGEELSEKMTRTSRGTISNDLAVDPRLKSFQAGEVGIRQVMVAPMVSNAAFVGMICLINKQDGSHFTDDELSLLSSIANLAALTMERNEWHRQKLAMERARQEAEHVRQLEGVLHRGAAPRDAGTLESASAEQRAERIQSLYDRLHRDYERLQELEGLRQSLTEMVVHDLRAPLAAMQGHLELLGMISGDKLDERGQGYYRKILYNNRSLIEMVSSVLDVSRLESGQLPLDHAACNLNEMAEESISVLEGLLGGKRIEVKSPTPRTHLICDYRLIGRVLSNLLGNAIKFSPPESTIELRLESRDGRVRVEVADQGPGIDPADRERIFEKFGQARSAAQQTLPSTGLGLTFCRLAVEAHGGRIGVDSVVGKGSTFWLELPVKPPPGAA